MKFIEIQSKRCNNFIKIADQGYTFKKKLEIFNKYV